MLAENYLYTAEAMEDIYEHLEDGRIMQITRMASAMETLRLLADIHEAFRSSGSWSFADSLACIYTWPLSMTTLAKKGAFNPDEIAAIRDFTAREEMDLAYLPGDGPSGSNDAIRRTSAMVSDFLTTTDKDALIRAFPRGVKCSCRWRRFFTKKTVRPHIFPHGLALGD